MRIQSVTAHAFGPFRDETLELADGMTVIVGDNEAGKSSWHAAIFAALCGMRRRRGAGTSAEREFAERHKPWGHDHWLVSAQIQLDDGRLVEMRQDLANRVECSAMDRTMGRDISAEIMHDGTPDAARWLGLDRSSFMATACIKQGQVLRVVDDAQELQNHLQRAAATAGSASTAAKAIDRLDAFVRERIGTDRINSTKPLRSALDAVRRAEEELDAARASHKLYVDRVSRIDELRRAAADAGDELKLHEAAAARDDAQEKQRRVERARKLHESLGGVEPPAISDDDDLANRVSEALAQWHSRPAPTSRPQRSSQQIREELESLPPEPDGDTEPHDSVTQAAEEFQQSVTRLESHAKSQPTADFEEPQGAATDEEIYGLLQTLTTALPVVPQNLFDQVAAAEIAVQREQQREGLSTLLITAGATVFVIGVVLVFTIGTVPGIISALAGVALALGGFSQRDRGRTSNAGKQLAEVQAALHTAQQRVTDAQQRRSEAEARCAQLGIPADPAALRAALDAAARAREHRGHLETWKQRQAELEVGLTRAAAGLANALMARGHSPCGRDRDSVAASFDEYRRVCRARFEQAAQAARRGDLNRELKMAEEAEERAAADDRRRLHAEERVIAMADECGISSPNPDAAAEALKEWTQQRTARVEELSKRQKDWVTLQELLAGKSLDELKADSDAAWAHACELAAGVDQELLACVENSIGADKLPALREASSNAERELAAASGELQQFETQVGNVAEAEEALELAKAELKRLQDLKDIAERTRKFLEDAQDRVHRDITPRLVETLKQWLPRVTGGRYTDAVVDPATLRVRVRAGSGPLRDAQLLSHGTAEQIYLLLRVALVDHVTNGHDTCPLLLDDVTVHTDKARTHAILELLLEIAELRQVILFTQEQEVADWARNRLGGPHHRLHELQQVAPV